MFSVIVRDINLHVFANKGSLGGGNSDDNDHDVSDTTFNGRSLDNEKSASARISTKPSEQTPNHSHPPNENGNDSDNASVLLEILIRHTSTLVTTVLIMITAGDPESFALQHLRAVIVGRFNPSEPGDIHTFKRGEHDKTVAINPHNSSEKRYTVTEVVPVLFQLHNNVFIDQETVMRLIFLNVIKCINTMTKKTETTNRSSIKYNVTKWYTNTWQSWYTSIDNNYIYAQQEALLRGGGRTRTLKNFGAKFTYLSRQLNSYLAETIISIMTTTTVGYCDMYPQTIAFHTCYAVFFLILDIVFPFVFSWFKILICSNTEI